MRDTKRIITALSDVDDRYIEVAEHGKKNKNHLSWKKATCFAACLILLLSLSVVVYAKNWFGIRDLLLPAIRSSSEKEETDIIGLSGYQGSAEWQALAEWQEFVSQYDPSGMIYQDIGERLDSSFARYSSYLVYSQEMANQMLNITQKYSLKLHTTSYDLETHKELVVALGNFLGEGTDGYFMYMYEDGTFEMLGSIQYEDIGTWDFQFLRSVKGTFHDAMLDIGDIHQYREMQYETKCGITVTLALGANRVLVLADLEDSFVTLTIPYGTDNGIEQSHLEILADRIDYLALTPVIKPSITDTDELVNVETDIEPDNNSKEDNGSNDRVLTDEDREARRIYVAMLRNLMYSNILPDGSIAELPANEISQFAVGDVDSDGKEELVLLYDPGVMAGCIGYIVGYDSKLEKCYIQLETFPAFEFLENGNLKVLSSHNQTYGSMWPYSLYQYVKATDSYKLIGNVYAEDKSILESCGRVEQYHYDADNSGAGTVYFVGEKDIWQDTPIDKTDYLEWLKLNQGNAEEIKMEFVQFTEENIGVIER